MYLAKHVLIPLGLSVADAGIHKESSWFQATTLAISKTEMKVS